jgi:hypothetical protein
MQNPWHQTIISEIRVRWKREVRNLKGGKRRIGFSQPERLFEIKRMVEAVSAKGSCV